MGGTTTIQQPSPPPAPTVSSGISDYIQNQPRLFELQQQQAPLEAAQQLSLLQEFGPQFGQAIQDAQRQLNPQTSALQEQLAGQATAGIEQGLTPAQEEQFLSDFRANLGTNAGSPIGALETSRQLQLQREAAQQNYRNLGLSLAGRQQLAQPQAPSFTNMAGSFTPGQALGFNQGVYGSQANIFGTQAGMFNQQQNQVNPFGQMVGGLAGTAGQFALGKGFGIF